MTRRTLSWLRLDVAAPLLLMFLAFMLPFEARRPVLNLGFIQITSVELILYLVIMAWGVGWIGGQWRSWSACHTGLLIWLFVVFLSAMNAPFERAAAIKFALRTAGGCALFFAAADLTGTYRQATRCAIALAAGAFISAAAGCAEVLWPPAAALLNIFKTQPSLIGGYLRAGGTFQYANIAAMYWEAVAPLCIVLALVYEVRDKRKRWTWIFVAAALLIVEAVMLSMSRAAIALVTTVMIFCLALARLTVPLRRMVLLACGSAAVLPLLGHLLLDDSLYLRIKAPEEASWYRAEYVGTFNPLMLRPGQVLSLPVKILNLGAMMWRPAGEHPFALSYHWEDPQRGGFIVWDGLRTQLSDDVRPGANIDLRARILAPSVAGHYTLHLDMVHEGTTWFSLQGSPAPRIAADIKGPEPQSGSAGVNTPPIRPRAQTFPSRHLQNSLPI